MNSIRQRKNPKPSSETSNENNHEEPSKTNTSWLPNIFSRKTLAALVVNFIFIYINFPAPSLPKHVQHWRDSGHFFNYNGHKVFYRDIVALKNSTALLPVLLIIHGYPTSGYDFKDLIPGLQKRFRRIVVPDMLGLGFSDKPRDHEYNTMEQATIIQKLLASLKISNVHILAHDYGDTVTQELVARSDGVKRRRLTIESICLSNGGILPSSYQPLLIQKLMILPGLNIIAGRISNWYLFRNRMSVLFGPTTQPPRSVLKDFYRIVRHNDGNLVLPFIMQYLREREVNEERWVSALQNTDVPLHLIYGPHDPINTPDRFLTSYREKIPNSGVSVMEQVGHYPQVEDPDGFMDFYNKFLDQLGQEVS